VAILVAINTNEAVVTPAWRLAVSAFGRSLEAGGQLCVGAFGRSLASVAMKVFSHVVYFMKKFYKFPTLSAVCKDGAAMNCITA
jgi:hypothetical protein